MAISLVASICFLLWVEWWCLFWFFCGRLIIIKGRKGERQKEREDLEGIRL